MDLSTRYGTIFILFFNQRDCKQSKEPSMKHYKSVQAVILAAGSSRRLNTGTSKMLEKICGQELILYPTSLFEALSIPTTVVVGHESKAVTECIEKRHKNGISFVHQKEQLGTGHALACTKDLWNAQTIIVINGDMPLMEKEIIAELYDYHIDSKASMTVMSACCQYPSATDYGRIVLNDDSTIEIVEAKNATQVDDDEDGHINAGVYVIETDFLRDSIGKLTKDPIGKEFYITDLVKIANAHKKMVSVFNAPFDNVRGVNTLEELWITEHLQRSMLIRYWMDNGVRFASPSTTHLDNKVTIGKGTVIGTGVHLTGTTTIGSNCTIQPYSLINDSTIEDGSTILSHSIIDDSHVKKDASVGPFAHLRAQTIIHENAVVGNFVEVKNSSLGSNSKAKHLSYLGDTIVGEHGTIGAGTITCNYDGTAKHKTVIEDNVFIGSNNTLVAPLTIATNSYTAAGSTITENVPENSLAFGRARQVTKKEYRRTQKTDDKSSFVAAKKSSHNQEFDLS